VLPFVVEGTHPSLLTTWVVHCEMMAVLGSADAGPAATPSVVTTPATVMTALRASVDLVRLVITESPSMSVRGTRRRFTVAGRCCGDEAVDRQLAGSLAPA
jgi:hypothetical protein